jgi:hypothetical protein
LGYYVSLLAEARGHRPLPSVSTIQDLKNQAVVRIASEDVEELIEKNLHALQSKAFELSIYFGRNLARKYDRLALSLFNLFPAPLLRASFAYRDDRWELDNIRPISASEIPQSHRPFVVEMATEYFAGRGPSRKKKTTYRYDLAVLVEEGEENAPSDEKALDLFKQAAEAWSLDPTFIERDDYGKLHPHDDPRESLHLSLRQPGGGGGDGGDRRSAVHPALLEQGLPGRSVAARGYPLPPLGHRAR